MVELLLLLTLQTTLVKNPSALVFTASVDHDVITAYEVDFVRVSDNVVVQTINAGKPPKDAAGDITVSLNVHPVTFGVYLFRARAVAGALKSADSDPSPQWERAPGKPANLRVPGDN